MTDVATPATEAELAETVRAAYEARTPLEIAGGGTRLGLGRPVQAARGLSLSRLSGVSLYDPGALTIVVRTGEPLSAVEAAVATEGQRLPFEPMDHRALLNSEGTPTIGAVVACNISGPRRVQAGACRDSLLGVRFVDGQGRIVKNGGRVMKNVTGYDLGKLMCGAFGTLGVLTEVAFKLLPLPEQMGTIAIRGLEIPAAVKLMSVALGMPFEVSGAAHLPDHESGPLTAFRVEGFKRQQSYRAAELRRLLGKQLPPGADMAEIVGADHESLWAAIRDVRAFADQPGAVWRLSVKPSAAPEIVSMISSNTEARFQFDWGGGLIWVLTPEDDDASAKHVRGAVAECGGHATLIRAPASIRAAIPPFQPEPSRLATLSEQLREKFDPAGILNPGRLAPRAA